MSIFGLTGGIACGKSHIAEVFMDHNITILDADVVARQVVVPGSPGLEQIVQAFGQQVLHTMSHSLDRNRLAEIVFSDPAALATLNAIMHPLIAVESQKQLQLLEKEYLLVGYSAALLVENNHINLYRPLIVVSCPTHIQIERLIRRGLTKQQALDRIAAQLPDADKIKVADYVVDASGTKHQTKVQLEAIIKEMQNAQISDQ